MTLGRLALVAALGMALTALAVYTLTAPTMRPPVVGPGPNPEVSAPLRDAAADSSAERVDLTQLQQEIERLRALLDASAPVDVSLDASVPRETPASAPPAGSVSAPPAAPPVLGVCSKPLSDHVWRALLAQVPAASQLPPEKLELARRGSPECSCSPGASGEALCADWCGAKGFPLSRCVINKCQCFR